MKNNKFKIAVFILFIVLLIIFIVLKIKTNETATINTENIEISISEE